MTEKSIKYTVFEVFAAVLTVSIGGLLFGVLLAFVFLKLTDKKQDILPVMSFVNPNYSGHENPFIGARE